MIGSFLDRVLGGATDLAEAVRLTAAGEQAVAIDGLAGLARRAVLAHCQRVTKRPLLIVVADPDQAERIVEDLPALGFQPDEIGLYPDSGPALDDFLPETRLLASSVAPERRVLARRRVTVLERLAADGLRIIVAPITAVARVTLGPLRDHRLVLTAGEEIEPQDLAVRLSDDGYERVELVEAPGQFALRGGLVDVFPTTAARPVRLDFFGDELETLREFDPANQRSLGEAERVVLLPARERDASTIEMDAAPTLLNHLPESAIVALEEPLRLKAALEEALQREARQRELAAAGESSPGIELISLEACRQRLDRFRLLILSLLSQSAAWLGPRSAGAARFAINSGVVEAYAGDLPAMARQLRSALGGGQRVAVVSAQPHRVVELLAEHDLPVTEADAASPDAGDSQPHIPVFRGQLSAGFRLPGSRLILLTDAEIFPRSPSQPRSRPPGPDFQQGRPILSLLELQPGDFVVHELHGIGRYSGLVRRQSNGVSREFLQVDYRGADRLFVPSDQLDRVQKFIGGEEGAPTIHRLGGAQWKRTKSRVRARVREMAEELLALYARRRAENGIACGPDTVWQQELESSFPYRETPDQLRAINDVRKDMEQARIMDRLVCGDVGYGKTEVAIRAAFKAVTDGRQVAVLVPTTVLAQQHYTTFSERLAAFPVKIALLSRFRTAREQKEIVASLKSGEMDICIGTHRLLSQDVEFHDLGLIVVDEEQRFGVAHKERLKQLKSAADALTLTATPIPRTLHMALTGIRDMSVIEEPPEGRLAVRTYCLERDDHILREAILRELDRGGQIYYVHNRVQNIHHEARRLQRLAPQARVRIGHGQMSGRQLEQVMLDFYEGRFDILLCTSIIESGLDIANVNTIVVNNADHFGLAQLHQLRGRVGRGNRQAYCYLLYKPQRQLTEAAEKRLSALQEFTALGAGFQLAMRDMEIRGAGNLLGPEQHGNIAAVGFGLYCQMIEEEIRRLQDDAPAEFRLPAVSLPVPTLIPQSYMPTEGLRIAGYRRIAGCRTEADVSAVQEEFEDRFGDPPRSVWNLLAIMRLRLRCLPAGVARIQADEAKATLWLARKLDSRLIRELRREARRARFLPDRIELYHDGNPLRPVENLIDALASRGGQRAVAAVQKQLQAAEKLAELTAAR